MKFLGRYGAEGDILLPIQAEDTGTYFFIEVGRSGAAARKINLNVQAGEFLRVPNLFQENELITFKIKKRNRRLLSHDGAQLFSLLIDRNDGQVGLSPKGPIAEAATGAPATATVVNLLPDQNGFSLFSHDRLIWQQQTASKTWVIDLSEVEASRRNTCYLAACRASNLRVDRLPYLDHIKEDGQTITVHFKLPLSGLADIRI